MNTKDDLISRDARTHKEIPILKGVGKISGDGWKDTTYSREVVYVWNRELPEPYEPGQYPRIGGEGWTASTDQYDFSPASQTEVEVMFAAVLNKVIRATEERVYKSGVEGAQTSALTFEQTAPQPATTDPLREIVIRYIDRMNDVAPECGDPAERIVSEFARDVNTVLRSEFSQASALPKYQSVLKTNTKL